MPNIHRPEFEPGERPKGFTRAPSPRTPEGIHELEEGEVLSFPIGERLPKGGGLRGFFLQRDAVDYWTGEDAPDNDA